MDERQHQVIARWERRWLVAGVVMLVVFVVLIAYSLITQGGHIVHGGGKLAPDAVQNVPLFASPGVREVSSGEFQVGVVARAFAFDPSDIVLPVGARTRFYLTSVDVLHGYLIQGTAVNIELIPGQLAYFDYTFAHPGTFHVVCDEYCGINHQDMVGTITVVPVAAYRQRQAAGDLPGHVVPPGAAGSAAAAARTAAPVDGQHVFDANCAACHQQSGQGHPGAFPPLAGHAPELYLADRSYPIDVLLYGLQGPITVAGKGYDNAMPGWSQLSDAQLAAVANYTMQAWGNDGALGSDYRPYTAAEVADARAASMSAADVRALRGTLGLP
jgi:cytochrome c oxidase subunit 2